jgi:hypothetical protein
MRDRDHLAERLEVAFGRRGNRRIRREGRISGRHGPRRVQGELRLEIDRLFGPQRPVVVEHSDARRRRHVVLAGGIGHGAHERDDARPGCAVVP